MQNLNANILHNLVKLNLETRLAKTLQKLFFQDVRMSTQCAFPSEEFLHSTSTGGHFRPKIVSPNAEICVIKAIIGSNDYPC